MEQFGTSGVPIPCRMKPTYGGTLVFSCLCSGSPLCHHYTDTSLIRQVSEGLSLYSEFQRAVFNGIRKRSLYWLGHLGVIYQRVLENNFHIPPEETFKFVPYLTYFLTHFSGSFVSQLKWLVIYLPSGSRWERHFVHSPSQMVAAESKFLMRASAAIIQKFLPSGSRWDWRFGECAQKKSLPVVADEKDIFRTTSIKNAKK